MYHTLRRFASHSGKKITSFFSQETESFFHWIPVAYGFGIAIYFALKTEPPLVWGLCASGIGAVLFALAWYFDRPACRKASLVILLAAIGFSAVTARTAWLATPQLQGEIGVRLITGDVVSIDRLPSYSRVTLENVTFARQPRSNKPLPEKVRLSLRGRLQPDGSLMPGTRVSVKAALMPPKRPVAPGAYNFRQRAYFEGIGAVGYAVTPLEISQEGEIEQKSLKHQVALWVAGFRTKLTSYIRQSIPGQSGAVVAALVTGDRAGISDKTRQAFADAGIAHILAISGLHLSLVAGLIFFLVRGGLTCIPSLALSRNTKKWAALLALLFTFLYLVISGATIPAQRAFIMTSLVLLAVMTDRVALTMRNVALAALAVLILLPEALIGPSFQLSFAAVIALVATYEKLHPKMVRWQAHINEQLNESGNKVNRVIAWGQRVSLYISGVIVSSLVATLATAPFTIFTFNRFSVMALLTNLLAIPLVSFGVMPLIVFILLTAPLTMGVFAPLLGGLVDSLINLAFFAQSMPGAVILVSQVETTAQILCVIGMLWVTLWASTRVRVLGVAPVLVACGLFYFQKSPDVFIAEDQNLIGVRDSNGRAWVNTLQAGRFARNSWMQLIGLPKVIKSTERNQQWCPLKKFDEEGYAFNQGNASVVFRSTVQKKWRKKIYSAQVGLVISSKSSKDLTSEDFKKNGGHFIWVAQDGFRIQTVADTLGERPWS